MLNMLEGVVNEGTGVRLRYKYKFTGPIAGKTGTTNSNSDGWFVGCVPHLVTACWVGGEERDIHFLSTSMGQGAATALPVWANYMQKVYNDASLGYVQTDSFDVKVDSLQLVGDSLLEYNFANPSSPSSTPSTTEDDDVESYFE
jgi:penicillin-binding protein 1A